MTSVPNSVREDSSAPKAEAVRTTETHTERVIPAEKISGESRIVGSERVGEKPPDKESNAKPAEPDLRHRICPGGPCKEPEPKPKPPESDLRHRICLHGPCTCPPGQTLSKNGCVATTVANETPGACAAGQYWNGTACLNNASECAILNTRAASLITELHALRARLEQSCGANPPAQDCDATKLERAGTRQRYEMLLTDGPPNCAAALPPSASFYDEFQ